MNRAWFSILFLYLPASRNCKYVFMQRVTAVIKDTTSVVKLVQSWEVRLLWAFFKKQILLSKHYFISTRQSDDNLSKCCSDCFNSLCTDQTQHQRVGLDHERPEIILKAQQYLLLTCESLKDLGWKVLFEFQDNLSYLVSLVIYFCL